MDDKRSYSEIELYMENGDIITARYLSVNFDTVFSLLKVAMRKGLLFSESEDELGLELQDENENYLTGVNGAKILAIKS